MPGRSAGGTGEGEIGLTVLRLIGAGRGHGDLDPTHADPDQGADLEQLEADRAAGGGGELGQYNRAEQLAFWINLYNALTVRTILEHYPVASIRDIDISGGQRKVGPWDGRAGPILNDIQHRILRPIWRDPRILYALSCGALSCPNLQPVPFASERLDHQLSQAAMAYINDPRCIKLEEGQLVVSSLLRWYQEDFGGSDRAVINHLMGFAAPGSRMKLQQFDRIDGDVFDWRLNDATTSAGVAVGRAPGTSSGRA